MKDAVPNPQTQIRILRFISGAFAVSIAFSCGLFFTGLLLPAPGQEINQMMTHILTVLGFLTLAISKPVSGFVAKTMTKNQGKASDSNQVAIFVISRIVGLAVVESGSLFGLVASVNSGSSTPCLLLSLGALFCIFNQWPKAEDVAEDMSRTPRP